MATLLVFSRPSTSFRRKIQRVLNQRRDLRQGIALTHAPTHVRTDAAAPLISHDMVRDSTYNEHKLPPPKQATLSATPCRIRVSPLLYPDSDVIELTRGFHWLGRKFAVKIQRLTPRRLVIILRIAFGIEAPNVIQRGRHPLAH